MMLVLIEAKGRRILTVDFTHPTMHIVVGLIHVHVFHTVLLPLAKDLVDLFSALDL